MFVIGILIGLILGGFIAWRMLKKQNPAPYKAERINSLNINEHIASYYFENSQDISFAFDEHFNLLTLNQKASQLLDITSTQSEEFNWVNQFLSVNEQQAFKEKVLALKSPHQKNTYHLKDIVEVMIKGKAIQLSLDIYLLPKEEFKQTCFLGIAKDVTHTQEVKQALDISSENFHNIVDISQTGILIINRQGIIEFANPAAKSLLTRNNKDLLGTYFGTPILSDASQHSEFDVIRNDGSLGVADMSFTDTSWHGEPAYLVMMYDITELKSALQQIEEIALHDVLTGLPNRRLFNETLKLTIERNKRNKHPFSLLFLDLDQFKTVNDTMGHQVGDELLIQATQRINNLLRNTDFMARMGGDEFTILLDGKGSRDQVIEVCNKILKVFEPAFTIENQTIHINVSIGIVFYPNDATDIDNLLKMADLAMYQAKKLRHKSYHFYHEELLASFSEAHELEKDLKRALENQEFELYYQPQANATTFELSGMEALIRWNHPDKGLVPPDCFIPFLEASGLIVTVGDWVLKDAVRQIKNWLDQGYHCPRIAINVCVLQFIDSDFAKTVKTTLEHYAISPKYLAVEITESMFIDNKPQLIEQLHTLQKIGVHIHMDDFGTGYSSLSMIKDLPFDTIKIDQSFVKDLLQNERERVMVSSIINTIHAYGKQVLVEGVELETQRAILAEDGCDFIQGYLYARPMKVADLTPTLISHDSN